MLTSEKRSQFEGLLACMFMLMCEHGDKKHEVVFLHVIFEIMAVAEKFGASKEEMLAINHNAHCRVCGKPVIDVDKYIENLKLYDILGDIKIE